MKFYEFLHFISLHTVAVTRNMSYSVKKSSFICCYSIREAVWAIKWLFFEGTSPLKYRSFTPTPGFLSDRLLVKTENPVVELYWPETLCHVLRWDSLDRLDSQMVAVQAAWLHRFAACYMSYLSHAPPYSLCLFTVIVCKRHLLATKR